LLAAVEAVEIYLLQAEVALAVELEAIELVMELLAAAVVQKVLYHFNQAQTIHLL
jgi:hypothetical protein